MSLPTPSTVETLLDSLGQTTPDAFHFLCAFQPLSDITDFPQPSRAHLDTGLKAAYATDRPDVAAYVVSMGADPAPLAATIGHTDAQRFLDRGTPPPATPIPISATWCSERERSDLRLHWTSLDATNRLLRAAVASSAAIESPNTSLHAPGVLHLAALYTSATHEQRLARLAWMRFALLERGADINAVAAMGNVHGTPLHFAVDEHGEPWENRDILKFLLENGADARLPDRPGGQTPGEYVREQLDLPDDCLAPQAMEFYSFAQAELAKAERKTAANAAPERGGLFARIKGIISRS